MGKYTGWYSVTDEAFVSETEIIERTDDVGNIIHVAADSENRVEWTEEETYKFRLTSFEDDLKYWLKDGTSIYNLIELLNSFLLKKVVILIYKTVFRKYSKTGNIP